MSVRINARLEGELARKLEQLRATTGKSTTEIVRASLETYFERMAGPRGPKALLSDFVGCCAANETLSEDYKSELTRSLHGKQVPPLGATATRKSK
jgi:Ribbon-helix-helix protein, copG family